MKYLVLFCLLSNYASAEEKTQKINTSISAVTDDHDTKIVVPHQIPNLEWDSKGIQLIRREVGKQKYIAILKGAISKHQVQSFTYQVDGYDAHPIQLVKNKFNIEVPLEKSPAVIRLWLEVTDGRDVRIYNDEVHVVSDVNSPGAGEEKHVNY